MKRVALVTKLTLAIVLTLTGVNKLSAQVSFVQVASAPSTLQSANSSVAVTYASAQSAGNLNIVVIGWGDIVSTISSVVDTRGNSYSLAGSMVTGTNLRQSIYYAKNILAGTNTVTVTFNQTAAYPDVRVLEYSGLDTTSPLDVTVASIGTGNTADSGYATTTSATDLIFAAGTSGNTFSAAGSGYTSRIINVFGNIAEDKTVTGIGSYNATAANNSATWIMQLVAFRASGTTRMKMHQVTSPVVGYRYATTTQGQGVTSSITNSVAGPTSGVQLTKAAGSTQLVWISPPLATAVTISGTVTMNGWASESTNACNCGMQVSLHKYSNGSESASFLNSERGVELGSSVTQQNWTATPTSTSFAVGDRIVFKWWINDAGGTMASGKTVTTNYDGATAAASGDTWVQFTERLQFQPEPEVIQNKSTGTSGSTIDVTLNSTGAGHLMAVVLAVDSPSTMVTSVTDNAPGGSCSYSEANVLNVNQAVGGGFSDIWYCPNTKPGATHVTVTVSPAPSGSVSLWTYEVSNLDSISPLDASGINTNSKTSSFLGGSLTTTNGSTDFLAEVAQENCFQVSTISTPWTLDGHNANGASAYLTATGTSQPTFTYTCAGTGVSSAAAFRPASPNQAPLVDAGPNQTITLPTNTATLNGSVSDDGLPNGTLTFTWSKVSGPGTVSFTSPNAESTQATFSTTGTYVLKLTASDSQLSGNSNVTVTVNPQPVSLVLSPAASGPNVPTTSQTLTALLKDLNTGAPIASASVQFTVTGPNARTGSASTDASGVATFTYTGTATGNDNVQATYGGTASNVATVSWILPAQGISTGTIYARFFTSDGSGVFNIPTTQQPVFSMFVPTINFNPPPGTIQGEINGVSGLTRPMLDITTDLNGFYTGSIPMQGNGFQTGIGALANFQAVFTGAFTVSSASTITFNFYSDDGFIFGVGNGATRNHSNDSTYPIVNGPPSGLSPFSGLTVVGASNRSQVPTAYQVIVDFPGPGTYPYEVDYTECCGGAQVLTLAQASTNLGITPTGLISLTPKTPSSLNTGLNQTFTVLVSDSAGAAVQGATVTLTANGANIRQLTSTTDSTGHATFQYSGTNAGTDTIQASANISNIGAYSNIVNMTWTIPSGGGSTTFVPQGWIGSPATGSVIQSQVPITVASGITLSSGTLSSWPTSNPSAVTTLNANTTGTGTIGTIDATLLANGGYVIQLNATSGSTTQTSQITVNATGENKPGRMVSTVTEFKVPLAGIPITISRTYDSLDKSKVEDFGYGWKLGTFVDLQVDSRSNVTLNVNGQRVTFFFTPQPLSFITPWWLGPAYTPQAGIHGTLISDGCGGLLRVQNNLVCFPNTGSYQPTTYAYTDPIGRTYTISASGQLQSIKDLNGNVLTITPNGITSSVNGVVLPFVRDAANQNRITKITDANGKDYVYAYDGAVNLQSVTYPGVTNPETYTYYSDHSLKDEIDPRGKTSTATYYSDGRLQTISDTMVPANVWSYAYDVPIRKTTITNPDTGTVERTDDSFGKPLTIREQVDATTFRTTTYQYDANENLVSMTDPLTNPAWIYTYDANGFQTSIKDPLGHISSRTYNQFGGVKTATNATNTNTSTTTYDAFFNPTQVTDLQNGANTFVSSATFDALGNLATFTDGNQKTTTYGYDPQGNLAQVTDALNESTNYFYVG